MKRVLFACVHNAGRSQMAAALFNALARPEKARASSAGTEPGPRVHPEVVEVMREKGIDLSSLRPRALTPELAATVELLITMGCGEACPVVPGARRDDWPLPRSQGSAAGARARDPGRHRAARARAAGTRRLGVNPDRNVLNRPQLKSHSQ